jgi:methyl-accepting chemotaxis protein
MTEHAVAVDQITKGAESLSRLIGNVTRAMRDQTTSTNEIARAVASMKKEADQNARGLDEQTRAMRDVLGGIQNISKQLDLITRANKQHSARAGRVLAQLKDVRSISERNARSARDTHGGTGDLLRHAEALTGALTSQSNGSNGRA